MKVTALLVVAAALTAAATEPPSAAFLQRVMSQIQNASASSDGGVYADLARLYMGNTEALNLTGVRNAIAKMAARKDCSDFDVTALIRMLWCHRAELPADTAQAIETALLTWEFWIDEANAQGGFFQGDMIFFTENHQFSFHSSEYLAGSMLSEQIFPGTNMSGRQHADRGRSFCLSWLEKRYRWGFSEWKSETYMPFDVANLAHLASLAPDEDVREYSRIVLDLAIYDLGLHSCQGLVCTSRGRSYGNNKFSIEKQGSRGLVQLVTGAGSFDPANNHALALALACANVTQTTNSTLPVNTYKVPDAVLAAIAPLASGSAPMVSRERIGLGPDETDLAESGGLGYTFAEDGIDWWGLGAYAHPRTLHLAFTMGDAFQLWNTNETIWKPFGYLRSLAHTPILDAVAEAVRDWTEGPLLGPVTSLFWRTPEVALASALDFSKAMLGDQQHAWQATLNNTIPIFTTMPGPNLPLGSADFHAMAAPLLAARKPELAQDDEAVAVAAALLEVVSTIRRNTLRDGNSDDYADGLWTGSAALPRIAQRDNVLLAIYRTPYGGHPAHMYAERTHAYFPKDLMDEVADHLDTQGWILARSGSAYVALYTSSRETSWPTGNFTGRELVAEGGSCVWVCVVGREEDYGGFDEFAAAVLASTIQVEQDHAGQVSHVDFALSSTQHFAFGWDEPLVINGDEQKTLHADKRLDSPFALEPFPAGAMQIAADGYQLSLDLNTKTRVLSSVEKPPPAAKVAHAAAERALAAFADKGDVHTSFDRWGYESGVLQLGLWEISAAFAPESTLRAALSDRLDSYLSPGRLGWDIVHNASVLFPWVYSIGDRIGLFPAAYAARVLYQGSSPSYDNTTDMMLIENAYRHYIVPYPHHLDDGTLSRPIDWPSEGEISPGSKAVWADDSFMGTQLALRLAALRREPDMAEEAARQVGLIKSHLEDPATGLLHHGYDNATGHHSCCKWGRGNGWVLMAQVDALETMAALRGEARPSAVFNETLEGFQRHATAMLKHQSTTGRWHNILDDRNSYLETSVTAMTLYAFTIGVEHGWLDRQLFTPAATAAYVGVACSVLSDGTVSGIQGETAIHDTASRYGSCGADYGGSSPGLGSIMRALAAVGRTTVIPHA